MSNQKLTTKETLIQIAKFIASKMGVSNFGDQSDLWYDEIYGDDDGTGDDNDSNSNTNTNNGINLPVIPINPTTPEVGVGSAESSN